MMRLLLVVACAASLVSCRPVGADGALRPGAEIVGELTDADAVDAAGLMRMQAYHVDVPGGGAALIAQSDVFSALVSVIALQPDGSQTDRVGLSEMYDSDAACVIVPARRAGRYRVLAGGMADMLTEDPAAPTGRYRLSVVPLSNAPPTNCMAVPDRSAREILDEHYRELESR